MKKIIILLVVFLSFRLIGCDNGSGGGGDDPGDTPISKIAKIEITNTLMDDSSLNVDIYVGGGATSFGGAIPIDTISVPKGETVPFEWDFKNEVENNQIYPGFSFRVQAGGSLGTGSQKFNVSYDHITKFEIVETGVTLITP